VNARTASLAYVIVAIALTWPVARGLDRDLPGDFGDPLLNTWILSWDAEHILRALSGHPSALRGYWHANIYYPHPYALAYSDHLTAEAVLILPIYALTKNPLLCYNVLFLSTFVLSAIGMFLLARDLTGNAVAAFVAGLAFGFAPYRIGSIPHVQVLASMWMPFTILGFRRFFDTRRTRPLVAGSLAWLAQNLSCGYYLLFFSPVVAAYVVWELTVRRAWTDRMAVARLIAAVLAVAAATIPFVLPYLKLRDLGFAARSIEEADHYAADVLGYFTADPNLRLWGRLLQAWPHSENALFPGLAILVLAGTGIATSWRAARARATASPHRAIALALVTVVILLCVVLAALLLGWTLRLPVMKITNLDRALVLLLLAIAALLIVSKRTRATLRAWLASPPAILTIVTVFAVTMSFGPHIHTRGRIVEDPSLYQFFYDHVPGFDGLRVPARFAMIVAFGLAALAAYGAAAIGRVRRGTPILLAAAALILLESTAVPLGMNGSDFDYKQAGLTPLPPYVALGDATPPVYRYAAQLPANAAIVEFPFGEVAFETRYMFYSIAHWRRLVNGYSGGGPDEYGLLTERIKDIGRRPDEAWKAVTAAGSTHAIVHEGAYADGRGARVSAWLLGYGAREVARFDGDRVFQLR